MPGGLIQLAAVGAELENLIGNPQMTHFKMVYKRYSNFAMEPIELALSGAQDLPFDDGITLMCHVDRHADLLSHMYLLLDIPDIYSGYSISADPATYPNLGHRFQWIKELGTRMIDYVELSIGGQIIQKLQGEWIQLWHEMYADDSLDLDVFQQMVGNTADVHSPASTPEANGVYPTATLDPVMNNDPELRTTNPTSNLTNSYHRTASIWGRTLHIPLNFWFSRNSGMALPLVALQQHDVHIQVRLRPLRELYTVMDTDPSSATFGQRIPPQQGRPEHLLQSFVPVGRTYENQRTNMQNGGGGDYRRTGEDATSNRMYVRPRLLCTYIFLDEAEQKRFATTTHKYLIEREDYRKEAGVYNKYQYDLHLNHPIKTLVWYLQHDDVDTRNDWANYLNWRTTVAPYALLAYQPEWGERVSATTGDAGDDLEDIPLHFPTRRVGGFRPLACKFDHPTNEKHILVEGTLLFNGIELKSVQPAKYYYQLQHYQHRLKRQHEGVYTYSFALQPRNIQPSGACDMSRVKQVQLQVTTQRKRPDDDTKYNLHVVAVHYNVLEIMGGMAGLQYAN
jgi:hypothetical protein